MKTKSAGADDSAMGEIAATFVSARRNCKPIGDYPGDRPQSLESAYRIQDFAIRAWATKPAGWKVGRITGADAETLGTDRLAGPIFPEYCWPAPKAPAAVGVFENGFAAVEGEIVAIIAEDVPADKLDWNTEEALELVKSLHAGAEIASSPYAAINDDGPLVTISDFGNNFGLIIGDEIPDWKAMRVEDWGCRTFIDDELVGEQSPSGIPGGPIESLRFLIENTARRGFPLKKGMAVCTGAITGVHEIKIGQHARVEFHGAGAIMFDVVNAAPASAQAAVRNKVAG